jgi:succinate dehydrogenase / fumarate reductase cytochrome b subunit
MMIYRWHLGYVAWLLNRITGVAITFYLAIHIWVIHHLYQGEEGFNRVMHVVSSPVFKLLEIGLLGIILYHAMNGIRILIVEWGGGARSHKKLFWWMTAIAAGGLVFGAFPILKLAIGGGR